MEIHLYQSSGKYHLFNLIGEGRLRSYCNLDAIANYSNSNKFDIFHDEGDLSDHLEFISDLACEICLNEFNKTSYPYSIDFPSNSFLE